ncbi:MAG: FAD-dependent oxidoreductase, partial [Phycisphaerae bacterium]
MKNENYDLTIIGAGPGGYLSALKAAQMGAKVAVIEKHLLGGTCLNYGCIPSKALLASAMLKHEIEHADAWGIEVSGKAKVAWDKIQARKDKVLKTLRGGIKGLFKARGVDLYEGTGRFVDRNRLQVTGEDGSIRQIDTKKTIIAVGSVPFRIPGWPDDPEFVCTSDESLHWDELPKKL